MDWKKIVFLISVPFLFFLAFTTSVQAQNHTYCVWEEGVGCKQEIKCNPGCVPPVLNCPNRNNPDTCAGAPIRDCNCQGPGILRCKWKDTLVGGTCTREGNCGPGYEPSPREDPCIVYRNTTRGDCEGANAGTCVQSTIPQPVPPSITCDICGCDPKTHQESSSCPQPKCNLKCADCIFEKDNSYTAIGCITTSDPQAFIAWLLGTAIGIAGGIAFLLMLWGGFQIITSTGDPEKLNKGKEILTSAIIGLVVIIFSVFLLKLIGVDILQLPGFEK